MEVQESLANQPIKLINGVVYGRWRRNQSKRGVGMRPQGNETAHLVGQQDLPAAPCCQQLPLGTIVQDN